ncbi:GGDEF domain-containing protein [Actinoplanes derwentensis]|uniref:Diguanylate cyclase (GGDEF) domain-containing protein n=1 Tax=Actinoplanes derwentensis TaxID=113562 RepID=A0A1H2AB21_9ACTN|nr:GGDEF domain-containing protein [Actinoplanes derwentensis]GID88909.1 hypothetical protein Ade03nite_78330 [Actinoplanes derwentensis]SDT42696.1 diguanylate cyclase (GGDEF) domain-containing protein [Actinoplanes derwentensis]
MRKLLRRSPVSVDDGALLKRRRTIETAALVSRGLGIVSTALAAAGIGAGSVSTVMNSDHMRLACWAGVVLMALANVFAFVSRRRPASPWYTPLSAGQVVLDTTTILGIVVISTLDSGTTTWPLLSLAIAVAALRHRLPGALLVFAATSAGFTYFTPYTSESSFVLGVGLLIAVITGAQSSSLDHHLTELNEIRRELQHQATHDPMTGLPNRARLAGYADACAGRPLAVLLLDLNGFKEVNDTYGHAAGDVLLHEIGARLAGALGDEGLVGRLGGDEFLVLLPEADTAVVARTVTRIRDHVRQPVALGDGRTVRVGISAGVAMRAAGEDTRLDALTAEADAAMYREKRGRTVA